MRGIDKYLSLVLLIALAIILSSCSTLINPPSLPPVDLIDENPREGCNNNGVVDQTTEQCDDGNWIINDECDRCQITYCGDEQYNDNPSNYYNFTEQCDSKDIAKGMKQCSNTTGTQAYCGFDCRCYIEEITIPPVCGDANLDGVATPFGWVGEECDAANQAAGDVQCIGSGLGTACNLDTCTCSPCNNNGKVEAGEKCDDGNANPNDACNMCKPTACGDGIANNPNAAGLNEVCGEPGLAACPQGQFCNACQCVDKPVSACGDGKADAGEQCGEPGLTCPQYQTCDNNCKCKTERVVTPRCGDGYVSSPDRPGSGNEECDIGGGYSGLVYPAAPDTCPEPKSCVPSGQPNACTCQETTKQCGENEYLTQSACNIGCDETDKCLVNEQTGCFYCSPITDVCELAKLGDSEIFSSEQTCEEHCDGTCSEVEDSDERCFECEVQDLELCPQGTYKNNCPSTCDICNKVSELSDGTNCMQCGSYTCPSGMSKTQSACESSCDGECVVGASQGDVSCYTCQLSCEDYCANRQQQVGTGPDPQIIEDYLNANGVCKQSARTSVQKHTGQGCSCYSYSVDISGTIVCTGTPCGDVACGSSAECGSNPHYTVSCNWLGWDWVGAYDFVPQVGSQ